MGDVEIVLNRQDEAASLVVVATIYREVAIIQDVALMEGVEDIIRLQTHR